MGRHPKTFTIAGTVLHHRETAAAGPNRTLLKVIGTYRQCHEETSGRHLALFRTHGKVV
jgi:hypothetical protein